MILSKKDIVEFLHSRPLHPTKGSMRTISNLIEVARETGYQVKKVGIDQFEIIPNYFIKDYDKPVIINNRLPEELKLDCVVDGKPWGKIVRDTMDGWCTGGFNAICYLFTLKDGDKIDKTKVSPYDLAIAHFLGYVNENKDFITINYYPKPVSLGYFDFLEGKINEWK